GDVLGATVHGQRAVGGHVGAHGLDEPLPQPGRHLPGGGFEQRGGDVARRDGVDPDAVPGQFDGRRLGEMGDRGCGCAVGLHAAARLAAAHGGQVDDGAAAVSGHVTGGVAGARHDAEQVDAEHALEVGEVVVQEAAVHGAGDARVVAHDVQAAEGGDG